MLYAIRPTYPRAVKTVNHSSKGVLDTKRKAKFIAATMNPQYQTGAPIVEQLPQNPCLQVE